MRTNNHFIYPFKTAIVLLATAGIFSSCKKLVTVQSVTGISQHVAYADSNSTEANVIGIYSQLLQTGNIYNTSFATSFPLLSDEAAIGTATNVFTLEFSNDVVTTSNTFVSSLWRNNYTTIYQANSVLENLPGLPFLSTAKNNQLTGEARFLRAYCYFVLTNYFGKVPLAITSNYAINDALSRSDTSIVQQFIIDELKAADSLLPSGYALFGGARVRACKEAAEALLAREYLYRGEWASAELYATKVINSPLFTLQRVLSNVLVPNSGESIWEMWAASANYAYENFSAQSLLPFSLATATLPPIIPSRKLVSSFEPGDARQTNYLAYQSAGKYWYVYKYRDPIHGTDQLKIMRLAEMYLIRAEAKAQQNELADAAADINVIRNRAGLAATAAATQIDLLAAVAQERLVELCFEGHRWLDLKRTGNANEVMSAYRPATWKATAVLLPIPATELGVNANLLPQNAGY